MKTNYDQFIVRPFTPLFGAEIIGLDVSEMDNETTKRVHEAWIDWKVLVFRDQDITSDEQLAFALHFGEVDRHPYLDVGGSEDVSVLDNPLAPRFSRAEDPAFGEYTKRVSGYTTSCCARCTARSTRCGFGGRPGLSSCGITAVFSTIRSTTITRDASWSG